MSMKRVMAKRVACGCVVLVAGLMAAMSGCQNSGSIWRTFDGGAAPTKDYRPSASGTSTPTTTRPAEPTPAETPAAR